MGAEKLFIAGVQFLLLLLALSARESVRAWVADRLGDPTARTLGRVSLNPLRHLDLFGSVLLPILLLAFGLPVFGWARPAPISGQGFRQPYRDILLTSVAGPAVSFLLSLLATFAVVAAVLVLGDPAQEAGRQALLPLLPAAKAAETLSNFPLMFTLVRMATINAYVCVFHLIPLPPLDGGQIALLFLPPDWAPKLAAVRPYGIMISMALAVIGVVPLVLVPFYGILYAILTLFIRP